MSSLLTHQHRPWSPRCSPTSNISILPVPTRIRTRLALSITWARRCAIRGFPAVDHSRYIHIEDGANVSVVMHAGLLHQFRVFDPSHCPSLYDVGGNSYVCTGSGFLRLYSD
jgi:hypothetical protein